MSQVRAGGRLLIVVGASAVLVSVMVIVFRDPLTRAIVPAAAWLAWIYRSASVAIGQRIPWWLAVVIFAVAALTAVRSGRNAAATPAVMRIEPARSRLAHWEAVVALDRGSAAGRHVLVQELRSLVLSVLSRTEGVEPEAVEERLAAAGSGFPDCLRDLFGDAYLPRKEKQRGPAAPPGPLPLAAILDALEARLGGVQGSRDGWR